MTATRRPWRCALLLAAGSAWFVAQSVRWAARHPLAMPPTWDPALYLFLARRYFHVLQEHGLRALVRTIGTLPDAVPPLLPLSVLPLWTLFGDARLLAYATSALYGALLLCATALLARSRAGDAGAALAFFLGATSTAPVVLARDYQMDLPAAALLAAAVVALERAQGFRDRRWSIVAGGLAGLMLLAKTMSGAFLVAPALVALRRGDERRVGLRNAAAAGAVAALVASVWWGPHLARAVRYLIYYGWGAGALPYDPVGTLLGLRNLAFYLVALANDGLSLPYLVLALALLGAGLARGEARRPDALLWAWLLAGYGLLTLSRNKAADRYVIFLVPPVVVLLATALQRRRGAWRTAALATAVAAGGWNFVALTWPDAGLSVPGFTPDLGFIAYRPYHAWLRTRTPIPEGDWPIDRIVTALGRASVAHGARLRQVLAERAQRDAPDEPAARVAHVFRTLLRREPDADTLRVEADALAAGRRTPGALVESVAASREAALRPLRVLVLPDHPFVNASTLREKAEWAGAPVAFARIEPDAAAPDLRDFDAVVGKTAALGPDFSTGYVALLTDRLAASGFRALPGTYRCPDGTLVRLYLLGLD